MIVRQERRWTARGRSSQRNQGKRDEQSRDGATVAALPCWVSADLTDTGGRPRPSRLQATASGFRTSWWGRNGCWRRRRSKNF